MAHYFDQLQRVFIVKEPEYLAFPPISTYKPLRFKVLARITNEKCVLWSRPLKAAIFTATKCGAVTRNLERSSLKTQVCAVRPASLYHAFKKPQSRGDSDLPPSVETL